MIGMQFGVVEYTTAGESLRTVGAVASDETRSKRFTRGLTAGWTGDGRFHRGLVHKGDPLLTPSTAPEMLASQKEYLLGPEAHATS